MVDRELVDQVAHQELPTQPNSMSGLELAAPGGQPIAVLLMQTPSVEQVVSEIIPAFRAQTGLDIPLSFKLRAPTEAEMHAAYGG